MTRRDELSSIKDLFDVRLGNYVRVYDPHVRKTLCGPVVKIFRANITRNPGDVRRFIPCRTDNHRKHALKPGVSDLIVINAGDGPVEEGKTYAFPRHVNFVLNYEATVEIIENPRRKCKIPGCDNWSDQGKFVGDYCAPCASLSPYSEAGRIHAKALVDLKIIEDMKSACGEPVKEPESLCLLCGK